MTIDPKTAIDLLIEALATEHLPRGVNTKTASSKVLSQTSSQVATRLASTIRRMKIRRSLATGLAEDLAVKHPAYAPQFVAFIDLADALMTAPSDATEQSICYLNQQLLGCPAEAALNGWFAETTDTLKAMLAGAGANLQELTASFKANPSERNEDDKPRAVSGQLEHRRSLDPESLNANMALRGLSSEALAAAAGLSVSVIEAALARLPLDPLVVERIASALEVDPSQLGADGGGGASPVAVSYFSSEQLTALNRAGLVALNKRTKLSEGDLSQVLELASRFRSQDLAGRFLSCFDYSLAQGTYGVAYVVLAGLGTLQVNKQTMSSAKAALRKLQFFTGASKGLAGREASLASIPYARQPVLGQLPHQELSVESLFANLVDKYSRGQSAERLIAEVATTFSQTAGNQAAAALVWHGRATLAALDGACNRLSELKNESCLDRLPAAMQAEAHMLTAWSDSKRGTPADVDKLESAFRERVAYHGQSGGTFWLAVMADCAQTTGNFPQASAWIDSAQELAKKLHERFYKSELLRKRARLLVSLEGSKGHEKACHCLRRSIMTATMQRASLFRHRAASDLMAIAKTDFDRQLAASNLPTLKKSGKA